MKTFPVVLTEQDIQVIGRALGMSPYNEVVNTINSINRQINPPKAEVDKDEDA